MKNVLIGGIGNVLLGDDGVGPYVARLLTAYYDFEDGVEIVDLGTPALDLLDQLSGKDAVVLIDSLDCELAPGTVQLYRKEDIIRHCPDVRIDTHSPALLETMLSADLYGMSPGELLLIGVVGESYGPGCRLSVSVHAAVPHAFGEILRELDRVGVKYTPRENKIDPQIWWSSIDQTPSRANLNLA